MANHATKTTLLYRQKKNLAKSFFWGGAPTYFLLNGYTTVVCKFQGQNTIKVQKKSKFRTISLILKPDFLANIDIWTEETCKNFKNGKSLRQN